MIDPNTPNGNGNFVSDARQELAGMLQDGLGHPSTKPVLLWASPVPPPQWCCRS